jgi:hypothetical protein
MPFSVRLGWPYPKENQDPWFPSFEGMVTAMDASGFAAREDRQIVLAGGGTFTWDSSSGVLTWDDTIIITAAVTGFQWRVAAGNATLVNGQVLYADIPRGPSDNVTVTLEVGSKVPNTDRGLLVGIRLDGVVYFRNGKVLQNGDSLRLFETNPVTSTAPIRLIPSPGQVVGVTEGLIGHVYLPAGSFSFRVMLGCQAALDSATLRLRRESDTSLVTLIGGVPGQLTEQTSGPTAVPATGQYYWTLAGDVPTAVAMCSGITIT